MNIKETITSNKAMFMVAFLVGALSMTTISAFAYDGAANRPELTEEQKSILEEARALHDAGDHDAAKELLENSGIDLPRRPFKGEGPQLTDEQKEILDQAKALKDAGDEEGAKALLEANGITPPPFHHGKGFGQEQSAEDTN